MTEQASNSVIHRRAATYLNHPKPIKQTQLPLIFFIIFIIFRAYELVSPNSFLAPQPTTQPTLQPTLSHLQTHQGHWTRVQAMATPAVGSGAQLTEIVMTAALAKTLSKVQRKALETAMLKEVFTLINSDPDDHRECFEVALAKLETSNALEAETFSTWEGYRAFESKVKAFEEKRALFPDYTHMLPATDMLVISAVRELRRVKCDGKDCVSVELDKSGLWDWLPLALEVYELTDKPFMISKIGHFEQQRHESGPDGFVFYRPVPCPGILAASSEAIQWHDFEIPSTPVSISKQEYTHKARVLPSDVKYKVYFWGMHHNKLVAQWLEHLDTDLTEYSYTVDGPLPREHFRTSETLINPLHDLADIVKELDDPMAQRLEVISQELLQCMQWDDKQFALENARMDKASDVLRKASDVLLKALHEIQTDAKEQQATADMPGVPKDEN
ncbi:hypothetical protein G7Z17_g5470 [Cylindrodendrum hubeiense]|uniref:Uncharacterized protein n=1 Tax=Cylindrodendrum hubeiense TaxID=595255 RepID=A0A9P5LG46_9HYPO|nr:hypothetical protein G7Z17_g5470 [Cylindrodendrum hubeiense]